MINSMETRIAAESVRSLVWQGDVLVDWAAGAVRYSLDGAVTDNRFSYGDMFDAAANSPSGEYTVIYARLGTKGLVLRDGELIREINRSYYHADAYEYPIVLVKLKNGREAIIHCPDEYNRLEIDDLETGERLSANPARKPSDFFHSRLACSLDGATLLSAGWLWHPLDEVRAYDVEAALGNAALLDAGGLSGSAWAEESSAAFLRDGRLAVALTAIENEDGDVDPRSELRIFGLGYEGPPHKVSLAVRAGTMMAIGTHHLLTLHDFPRLINIESGIEEQSWPHIHSGLQTSGILAGTPTPPPLALDRLNQRCAIADATGITILQF